MGVRLSAIMGEQHMLSATDANSYVFGDILGMGENTSVRVARHKSTGKVIAIKKMKLKEANAELIVDTYAVEIFALKHLQGHPNIPKLHVCFHGYNFLCVGIDYASGGDLRHHLSNGDNFTKEQVSYLVRSIGSALNFIHHHKMLHRDVKPENIVLTNSGRPLLTDFGESHFQSDSGLPLCKESSGTQQYMAPEMLTPGHRHSFQADFWSLGVVMFEMLFRSRPFSSHCDKKMIYFSENHYRVLWDRVETDELEGNFSPQTVDWEKLAYCSESHRQSIMRFPKHDIQLAADNSLPLELRVPLLEITSGSESVSDECKDLLWGLLDVRVPLRLGTGSKYSDFINHPWFIANGHCGDSFRHISPPFVPDCHKVNAFLRARFPSHKDLRADRYFAWRNEDIKWSSHIKDKLQNLQYVAPSCYCKGGDRKPCPKGD